MNDPDINNTEAFREKIWAKIDKIDEKVTSKLNEHEVRLAQIETSLGLLVKVSWALFATSLGVVVVAAWRLLLK